VISRPSMIPDSSAATSDSAASTSMKSDIPKMFHERDF
jgi:hypothetical protein